MTNEHGVRLLLHAQRHEAQLAVGVSLATASAEINTLGLQLRGIEPEPGAEPRFEVVRTLDELTAAAAKRLTSA